MESTKLSKTLVVRLFRPLFLAGLLLTYSIGVGLSHYLGLTLNWERIIYGAGLGILLSLMQSFLSAYYDHPSAPSCSLSTDDPRYLDLKSIKRQYLLTAALSILTIWMLIIVILMLKHSLDLTLIIILTVGFLLCFFSAIPPAQWSKKGYGDVVEAVYISNLIPAIAFLMSDSSLPVLLITLTIPLTFLYLALRIAFELETYSFDRTHSIQTLVVRMDWQKAMSGHNLFILMSFLFVGIFSVLGQPWSITWPMFLPLVLGVFQIAQIQSMIDGKAPKWKLLKWTSSGTFAVMAYLVSFTLWIR